MAQRGGPPDVRPGEGAERTPPPVAEGGWTWKGLVLGPQADAVADDALASRRAVEPAITRRMADIKATLGGVLVGLKYRLKGEDRFKEKLAKMIPGSPHRSVRELATRIHDGIRYTIVFHSGQYAASVAETFRRLEESGYKKVVVKNSWGTDEYKGVNTRWRDPASGNLFELQFHTAASWRAKQQTHEMYEKAADPRTSVADIERLEKKMGDIMREVPRPDEWESIRNVD